MNVSILFTAGKFKIKSEDLNSISIFWSLASVPKTGSDVRERFMGILSNKLKTNASDKRLPFRRLSKYEVLMINEMPQVKFMFTRDPFERLLSAWHDKMTMMIPEYQQWKVEIYNFLFFLMLNFLLLCFF